MIYAIKHFFTFARCKSECLGQLNYEEDITKLRQLNEKVTKEKSKLVEQLMKNTGATDSVECKLDKATENLENKVTSEIHELKKLLLKELDDVKSQLKKSHSPLDLHQQAATRNQLKGLVQRVAHRNKFPLSLPALMIVMPSLMLRTNILHS